MDTLVSNARLVSPRQVIEASIGILAGKIVYIGAEELAPSAENVIDAGGRYVIPGLVDPHVHFGLVGDDDPTSLVQRDWPVESRAALHGGVTSILIMLSQMDSYEPMIDELKAWGAEHSYTDFGFTTIISTEEQIKSIPDLCDRGVMGFKHFLTAFKGAEGRQIGLNAVTEDLFIRSLKRIAAQGHPALAMVHAEDGDICTYHREIWREAGEDLHAWAGSRPNFAEYGRVEFAATMARELAVPLYFVHITTKEGVDVLQRHKAAGSPVEAEAVIHSLTVPRDAWESVGVWGKFVPPLRGSADILRLWEGLRSGTIEHVSTDHCSHSREEKEAGGGKFGDVWAVPPGISNNLEHWLPVMFTEGVAKGRISIQKMVELCCENNAKRFGLYPQKGALQIGSDADLVILDESDVQVDEDFYHGRDGSISIYMGQTLRGRPLITMLRGKVVVDRGQTTGVEGQGSFIDPRRLGAPAERDRQVGLDYP